MLNFTKPIEKKSEPNNAGKQKIVLRDFQEPVEVVFGEKKFLIMPGSRYFNKKVFKMLEDEFTKIQGIVAEKVKTGEIEEKREFLMTLVKNVNSMTGDGGTYETKNEEFTELLNASKEFENIIKNFRETLENSQFETLCKLIQWVVLDSVEPKWKEGTNEDPTQAQLDKHISVQYLEKFASEVELNNFIDIFTDMLKIPSPGKKLMALGEVMKAAA